MEIGKQDDQSDGFFYETRHIAGNRAADRICLTQFRTENRFTLSWNCFSYFCLPAFV
jgi:hypothetical protein